MAHDLLDESCVWTAVYGGAVRRDRRRRLRAGMTAAGCGVWLESASANLRERVDGACCASVRFGRAGAASGPHARGQERKGSCTGGDVGLLIGLASAGASSTDKRQSRKT